MTCEECLRHRRLTAESAMMIADKVNKRLLSALIVVVLLWFTTIGLFVWHLNQYDYETYDYEYSQDGEGVNIIGNQNGVDYYGAETSGD